MYALSMSKYIHIYLMFANDPRPRASIPGQVIPKTEKMLHDTSLLKLSIVRSGLKVSGAIQERE